MVSRWAQFYGSSLHRDARPLRPHVAYGNGDSGLYPGSTMKGCATNGEIDPNIYGTCEAPGSARRAATPSIEIRNSLSYGNTLGYSGTAGNSTYVHDTKFFDNAPGLATDSFASGHPGMPQECFQLGEQRDLLEQLQRVHPGEPEVLLRDAVREAQEEDVCPQFQTPVGTGILIGGGNRNLIKNNHIWDNWRSGVYLLSIQAALRGDNDPSHQQDTSNQNQFIGNVMGTSPAGVRMPNGLEVEWDSSGQGNCFQDNQMQSRPASRPRSDVPRLADLLAARTSAVSPPRLPCTAWDPNTKPSPPAATGSPRRRSPSDAQRALAASRRPPRGPAAGCGGGDKPTTGLAWDGKPKVFRPKHLPNDRVVVARVRNEGPRRCTSWPRTCWSVTPTATRSTAPRRFTTSYAHGLFGMLEQPKQLPATELLRLGKVVYIPAGASVPFYAAWRLTPATQGAGHDRLRQGRARRARGHRDLAPLSRRSRRRPRRRPRRCPTPARCRAGRRSSRGGRRRAGGSSARARPRPAPAASPRAPHTTPPRAVLVEVVHVERELLLLAEEARVPVAEPDADVGQRRSRASRTLATSLPAGLRELRAHQRVPHAGRSSARAG